MQNKIRLLHIAYWWGILADAAMAVLFLFPNLFLQFMPVRLPPDSGLRYGLLTAAPLMIGWTILLFWADRKPIERKVILLLTVPVVAGYVLVEAYNILSGVTTLGEMLPLFASQTCMSALFVVSYLNATSVAVVKNA